MGRDIRVESKHFVYRGSKSSDLLMAFDLFFAYHPEYSTSGECCFDIELSRTDMKRVLDFIEVRSQFYREPEELLERMNNIYVRMMPLDTVQISIT